jgi:tRNA(fMet)-specific endonuclease VapC
VEYLLDTNVVSEPLKAVPNPRVLALLDEHDGAAAIASPVWHELLFGAKRLSPGRKRAAVEAYLAEVVAPTLPVLPYDEEAADVHASQRARLTASGKSPAFVDGQIAAIALVHKLVVVTRNVDDFAPFRGLRVVNWFE